jgi:hypothetical protein
MEGPSRGCEHACMRVCNNQHPRVGGVDGVGAGGGGVGGRAAVDGRVRLRQHANHVVEGPDKRQQAKQTPLLSVLSGYWGVGHGWGMGSCHGKPHGTPTGVAYKPPHHPHLPGHSQQRFVPKTNQFLHKLYLRGIRLVEGTPVGLVTLACHT